MATVPKAQRQVQAARGPVVFQSPQQINAPAGAFGDQGAAALALAGAAAQGSDIVGKLAMDKLAQDNTREMKQLDTEYSAAIREMMYGTPQNPGGFYTTRGQDTLDQHPGAAADLEKKRQEIMKRASSPRVRAKLDQTTTARRESELNSMMVFGEKNRRVANDMTAESRISEASATVAAKINSEDGPAALRQGLTILSHEVMDMADRNGWSPETTTAKMMEAQTAMLKGAFDNILDEDPAKARVFFENNKNLIDGRIWDTMEDALEVGETRQQEQAALEALLTRFPNDTAAQLEGAKELAPELQDGVRRRIQDNTATKKRLDAAAQEQNWQEVWQQVQTQGIDSVDVDKLVGLSPSQHSAIRTFTKQQAADGTGYADTDDIGIYNEVSEMNREQLAGLDMIQSRYIGGLTEKSFKKFQDRRSTVILAKDSKSKKGSAARTNSQIRTDFLRDMSESDKYEFSTQYDDLVLEWEDENGKEAPPDVQQEIGDGLRMRMPRGNFWTTGQLNRHRFQNIEEEDRDKIDLTKAIAEDADAVAGIVGVPKGRDFNDLLAELAKFDPPRPPTYGNIRRLHQQMLDSQ